MIRGTSANMRVLQASLGMLVSSARKRWPISLLLLVRSKEGELDAFGSQATKEETQLGDWNNTMVIPFDHDSTASVMGLGVYQLMAVG